jgi:S1-C subfamily serine protease
MDREPAGVNGPAGVNDARPGTPWTRPARRTAVAGLVVIVALLVAVAVLVTRLVSAAPTARATAAPPSASPSATATLTVPAIYQRIAPSVVAIQAGHGAGTGVIVADDGTIITADHVIVDPSAIVVTYADGTLTTATIRSSDKKLDIALLTPARLPQIVVPATLGGAVTVGAPVVAIGNPLGLTDSVSAGVVSGLNRSADTDTGQRSGLIQFDAAVNPGSSGGPLLDSRGMVIGIVVALAAPDGRDAFAGIGFAVPIGGALGGTGGSQPGTGPQI